MEAKNRHTWSVGSQKKVHLATWKPKTGAPGHFGAKTRWHSKVWCENLNHVVEAGPMSTTAVAASGYDDKTGVGACTYRTLPPSLSPPSRAVLRRMHTLDIYESLNTLTAVLRAWRDKQAMSAGRAPSFSIVGMRGSILAMRLRACMHGMKYVPLCVVFFFFFSLFSLQYRGTTTAASILTMRLTTQIAGTAAAAGRTIYVIDVLTLNLALSITSARARAGEGGWGALQE